MKKNIVKKAAVTTLASVLALNALAIPQKNIGAATEHWNDASAEWTAYKNAWTGLSTNYENVSLTPGTDETKINLAWYSKTEETPKVQIAKSKDMAGAKEFIGTQQNIDATVAGYFANKATVDGLEENTTYYYQVFKNGTWSETKEYKTGSFKNYSILYVGDPQIGACKKQTAAEDGTQMSESGDNLAARNDSYNWNQVLTQATTLHDVNFMISAGDQVNTANKEEEYAGYLSANALSALPVATTIGNHDSKSIQYSYHFNNPNTFADTDTDYTTGKTAAGTDYYYTYGDVLFIVLDTNNYNCATHENVINKAIEENKDCKWRVVTFHQDIYGSGYDHSDSDGIVLRTQLTPIFDKYDIDIALQGHDHTYSRTYQLSSDGKEHTSYTKSPTSASTPNTDATKAEYLNQNNCYVIDSKDGNTVVNPKGTVYYEANSATGSKFYNLIATQQDYIAERGQSWTPNYSVINVSESAITVTTYDAKTGTKLENSSSYTIVKEADKTDLKNAIATAKSQINTEKYTAKSVKDLQTAITNAENVVSNLQATNEEIANAVGELSKATTGLQNKQAQNITATEKIVKSENSQVFTLDAKNSGKGTLTYSSSDNNVAMVDALGNVSVNGAGTATITVKATATEEFAPAEKTIKITVTPNAVNISKITVKGKKVKVAWSKNSNAVGYQIKLSKNKNFKKVVKTVNVINTAKTATVKKLKKKTTYYVKVRAYILVDNVKVYGRYSSVKKAVTK